LATSAALAVAIGASLGAARPTSCANRLAPGEQQLVVRLVDPGHAVGRTTPIDLDCQGTLRTRWPRDADVAAGRTARVTARWLPRSGPLGRPSGTLAVRRIESVTGMPSWLAESRNVVSRHT